MQDAELFAGIDVGDVHPNLAAYILATRGNGPKHLVHRGGEDGGTTNHRQGYDAAALCQVRTAVEGVSAQPEHAGGLVDVVADATELLRKERREGQCLGEVRSNTYGQLSALFRALLFRECELLLGWYPDHEGLRNLAGEAVLWTKIRRHGDRMLRAANGLIQDVGIRCKHDPYLNESPSLQSHCWDVGVTEPRVRSMIERTAKGLGRRMKTRATEVIALRLYGSEAGQRLEQASRATVPGRLAANVWVHRGEDGSMRARLPAVRVIHESEGMPPHVVFEVVCDGGGRLRVRLWETSIRVPVGEIFEHPDFGRRGDPKGSGWVLVGGPSVPIPEPEPWSGSGVRQQGTVLARDVTAADLEAHPFEATALVLSAVRVASNRAQPGQLDRLRRAYERYRARPTRPLPRLVLVKAAMAAVDLGLTQDVDLVAAVEQLRRAYAHDLGDRQ